MRAFLVLSVIVAYAAGTTLRGAGSPLPGQVDVIAPGLVSARAGAAFSATTVDLPVATNVITCGASNICPAEIRCPQGANCEVQCQDILSCLLRRIYCPDNFGCLIRCNYGLNQLCNQADFIQGSGNAAAFSLLCEGEQACDQGTVSGTCNTPLCQVTCSGAGPNTCTDFTCTGSGCPST